MSGRRTTERALLGAVCAVVVAYGVLVAFGESVRPDSSADVVAALAQLAPHAVVLLAAVGLVHAAFCRWAVSANELLFPLAVLLTGFGWVTGAHLGRIDLLGSLPTWFTWRSTAVVALAALVFALTTMYGHDRGLRARSALVLGVLAVVTALWPVGKVAPQVTPLVATTTTSDASWFQSVLDALGSALAGSIELAKVLLVMALAALLARRPAANHNEPATENTSTRTKKLAMAMAQFAALDVPSARWRVSSAPHAVGAVCVALLAAALLLITYDVAAALTLLACGGIVLAVTGVPASRGAWRGPAAAGFVFALALALPFVFSAGLRAAVAPWARSLPFDGTTELNFALATGGVTGAGAGATSPLVGEHAGQAMVSALAEQFGLLGLGVLVVAAFSLAALCLRAAAMAARPSQGAVAFGLVAAIPISGLLAFVAACGLLPPTNLAVPLVGTPNAMLVVQAFGLGLVLRATRTLKPLTAPPPEPQPLEPALRELPLEAQLPTPGTAAQPTSTSTPRAPDRLDVTVATPVVDPPDQPDS